MTDADWSYIWADYKLGNMQFLHDLYGLDEDVDKESFRPLVAKVFADMGFNGGYSIYGKTKRKRSDGTIIEREPVGFALVRIEGHRMEAHIHYFAHASKRNRLEGIIKFIQEMRQMYTIIVHTETKWERMFDHVCRYGIFRRVGTIYEYTDDLKEVIVYQSKST